MKPAIRNCALVGMGFLASFHRDLVAAPLGTAFTYQGVAAENGGALAGLYDVQCALYDAPAGGTQTGPTLEFPGSTADGNGVFLLTLDFGAAAFNGEARWLEFRMRPNGSTVAHTTLVPRQRLTPAPSAVWATTAGNLVGNLPTSQITGDFPTARLAGVLPGGLLSGNYPGAVTFGNAGNIFSGNGAGLLNVNADLLDGLHSSSFARINTDVYFNEIVATRLRIGSGHTLSGSYATIPGGYQNEASGNYSFATGYRAKAKHAGTFVSADSTAADWASTAPNQFLIRASGGVGINTAAPMSGAALDVAGFLNSASLRTGYLNCTGNAIFSGNNVHISGVTVCDKETSSQSFRIMPVSGYAYGSSLWMDSGGANQMYLGVGSSTASYTFTFYGNGGFRCRDLIETSDALLKRNIAPLGPTLDLVDKLRGVSFEWAPSETQSGEPMPQGRQIGLIAQEVKQVLPEVVHQDPNGTLSVAYTKLVPVLVEAMKEQRVRTEKIASDKEVQIQALTRELAELKAVVQTLVEQRKAGAP